MRLFVALKLSPTDVQSIEKWRKPLMLKYPFLRWTRDSQLHVTLRFLGERDPDLVIPEIKNLTLEELLPAEYTLTQTGRFGTPPSVLWLSGRFSSGVYTMAERLNSIPDGYGKSGESRPFIPHVTLVRIERGTYCPVISYDESITGACHSIHLISSRLTENGPVYSSIFKLER